MKSRKLIEMIQTLLALVLVNAYCNAFASENPVDIDTKANSFAALSVIDLEKSVSWYTKHFKLEPTFSYSAEDNSVHIVVLSRAGLTIELQKHASAIEGVTDDKPYLKHGMFKFGITVIDLKAAITQLEKDSVPVVIKPYLDESHGFLTAIIKDNSGNLIQLIQKITSTSHQDSNG